MSIKLFQWTGKHNLINRVFVMLEQQQADNTIRQFIKSDLYRHSTYHRHLDMVVEVEGQMQALDNEALDRICDEIILAAKGE